MNNSKNVIDASDRFTAARHDVVIRRENQGVQSVDDVEEAQKIIGDAVRQAKGNGIFAFGVMTILGTQMVKIAQEEGWPDQLCQEMLPPSLWSHMQKMRSESSNLLNTGE